MKRWMGVGLAFAMGVGGSSGWAQFVERDREVKITGPRGRTIDRTIRTERGPGFVERQVNIQRPGGTFSSTAVAARGFRPPAPAPFVRGGGPFVGGPRWGYGPPRPVVVNNGIGLAPAILGGAGLFGLGLFAGSALSSPPPPAPVYVAPPQPPVVVVNQPQPYSPTPPPPPTVVVDPVLEAMKRLQSYHNHSRRDGAAVLGRLRDPRAVPALVDRLKNDMSPEVRVASATALGDIGDPSAMVPLERAAVYDRRQAVRDAATSALSRFPRGGVVAGPATSAAPPTTVAQPSAVPGSTVPSLAPIENVPPPPTPDPAPGFSNNP